MGEMNDFDINNGVLERYTGNDENVVIPDGITSIGKSAFKYRDLISVHIPESVTQIGDYAFYNCKNLTSVDIPTSVTKIGNCAFSYCGKLTSVNIPKSVTKIGGCAFLGCKGMADSDGFVVLRNVLYSYNGSENNVTVPNGITSISDRAFSFCNILSSVIIPESVTSIGGASFISCGNLQTISIPDSVKSIGDLAFARCNSLTSITIPKNLKKAGEGFFQDTKIIGLENNEFFLEKDGFILENNGTVLTCYIGTDEIANIPTSVTTIKKKAFWPDQNTVLREINIPDNVKTIQQGAIDISLCTKKSFVINFPKSEIMISNDFVDNLMGMSETSCYITFHIATLADKRWGSGKLIPVYFGDIDDLPLKVKEKAVEGFAYAVSNALPQMTEYRSKYIGYISDNKKKFVQSQTDNFALLRIMLEENLLDRNDVDYLMDSLNDRDVETKALLIEYSCRQRNNSDDIFISD